SGYGKLLEKVNRPLKCTISTNHHQCFYSMLLQLVISLLHPRIGHKLFTARRLQYSASTLYNVGYVRCFHSVYITFYHTLVATPDAIHFYTMIYSSAYCCSYSCVHTGAISSGSHYANLFNLAHAVLFFYECIL